MKNNVQNVPMWFWIISGVALVWNLMGIGQFIANATMSAESILQLSLEEQALRLKFPLWTQVVFAIAVFAGTVGCVGLLLRKGWAQILLLLSLIAVVIQMGHSLFIAKSIEVYGPTAAILPAILIFVGIGLYILAKKAKASNWIS